MNFSGEMTTEADWLKVKGELKSEVDGLKAMLAQLETRLLRWNIILAGAVIAVIGLIINL